MKNKGYLAFTTCLIVTFPNQAEKFVHFGFSSGTGYIWYFWQRIHSSGGKVMDWTSLRIPPLFSEIIWSYHLNLSLLSSRQTAKLHFSLLWSALICLFGFFKNKVILQRSKILVLWNGMIKLGLILLSWGFSARLF